MIPYARSCKKAFTLVELLIVVTVVAILGLLTLAAIQEARGTSRRVSCSNNLRSIGVAINTHQTTLGNYPNGFGQPAGESYIVRLLPFMEQASLFASMNFNNGTPNTVLCSANGTALTTLVNGFTCPSDNNRYDPLSRTSSNYAANAGDHSISGDGSFIGLDLAPRDITDGLSQTAAVSEWVIGNGDETHATQLGTCFTIANSVKSYNAFKQVCTSLDKLFVNPNPPGYKGQFWIMGGLSGTQYNHLLTPNLPSCLNRGFEAFTSGSYHNSGVNSLLLDGSVRFVRESINQEVWSALGTRARGELVSGDSF